MDDKKNKKFLNLLMLKKHLIFIFIMTIIMIGYMVGIRPHLKNTSAIVNLELSFTGVILLVLALFLLALIVTALITLIIYIFFKKGQTFTPWILRLKWLGIWTTTLAVTFLIIGIISQKACFTPPIFDSNGNVLEGSIAELKQIDINGSKQWITIRGNSTNKPILLFLSGGPGGSQLAATRIELKELEKHFIVVNWDQPGSGKSFNAVSKKDLTVKRYINDGVELTKYLKNRFNKDKIYIVGESWGSALGILLAKEYPQLYYGFIGTGQMINFLETEKTDYELAKKLAKDSGDFDVVQKLDKQGPPPYYGNDVTWKSASYLMYLSKQMSKNSQILNRGYNTLSEVGAPEYGIYDKANYFRGIVNTFNYVYPQLYNIDFRKDAVKIDVPVYFFIGRHDINAPTALVEGYYNKLKAPTKELIWFEHSGHDPWRNESNKFVQSIVDISLRQK
ncbi:alpha/beta fold hydrolase [Clostridium sporogenes]|uniref:alpha/beta fold hydrolase n=1 Tax=Clostridium sporogenes TaxID=1509 RepID=UPI0013D19183|nr:alpha/beta fold hydrolase [Clostridium sporogenes]NFP91282.1 alpha/beta fold hydrolase [Clostridium sporogenes]